MEKLKLFGFLLLLASVSFAVEITDAMNITYPNQQAGYSVPFGVNVTANSNRSITAILKYSLTTATSGYIYDVTEGKIGANGTFSGDTATLNVSYPLIKGRVYHIMVWSQGAGYNERNTATPFLPINMVAVNYTNAVYLSGSYVYQAPSSGGGDIEGIITTATTTDYGNLTVTTSNAAYGSATGNNTTFTVPTTTNLTIAATPTNGSYYFINWTKLSGNCSATNTSNATTGVEVLDNSTCAFRANFLAYGYLYVNANAGGTASGNSSNFTVPATKNITATANVGKSFLNWTSSGNCTIGNASSNETNVTINDGVCTVTASFASTGNLIVISELGGTATGNNTTNFTTPATLPISATPNSGMSFWYWYSSGNCTITNAGINNTTVTITDGLCTVLARFRITTPSTLPPSCITVYSILGLNFTYTALNETLCSSWYQTLRAVANNTTASYSNPAGVTYTNETNGTITMPRFPYAYVFPTLNTSCWINTNATGGGASAAQSWASCNMSWINGSAIGNSCNSGTVNPSYCQSDANGSIVLNESQLINITQFMRGVASGFPTEVRTTRNIYGASISHYVPLSNDYVYSDIPHIVPTSYIYIGSSHIVRAWGLSSQVVNSVNTSNYGRLLLYFNSPYYGNIQLIPMITYIPAVSAIPDFINTGDNSAYIPNNTITYIYDSVTSAWYIVPAYSFSNFSMVGSTSVLSYNPLAGTTGTSGTVPIDITSLTGSCSYTNATRNVTCTGADSSSTIVNLTLLGYQTGNSTAVCNNVTIGASGTLTCILPDVCGTYSIYFFGTDANGFNHYLSGDTITSLECSTGGFGRNGYLAWLMVFGILALIVSSNLAVSMTLGVFGLFIGLAFGFVPLNPNSTIATMLAIIVMAAAYKLKV